MWIDQDGVAHTVALPRPTWVMSAEFRVALDGLLASHRPELERLVEDVEARTVEALPRVSDDEAAWEGVAAPRALLRRRAASVRDVRLELERVVPRWRLDAVLALGDYVDDLG